MDGPCALLLGAAHDELTLAANQALLDRRIPVRCLAPHQLGTVRLTLSSADCRLDGASVATLLWRVYPDSQLSDCFGPDDRAFADAEIGAAWLAAMHVPSLLSINRYDANAWFDGLAWPLWRRLLAAAGVPVSPFSYGDVSAGEDCLWYPYSATGTGQPAPAPATCRAFGAAVSPEAIGDTAIVICSHVVAGSSHGIIASAAEVLRNAGIEIARIVCDSHHRVMLVDPQPVMPDRDTARRGAEILADAYASHLSRR